MLLIGDIAHAKPNALKNYFPISVGNGLDLRELKADSAASHRHFHKEGGALHLYTSDYLDVMHKGPQSVGSLDH